MALSTGLQASIGQVISRTILLQPAKYSVTGIPVPLAVLDVVKEEMVTFDADISDHPVESGPEITDHIQLKNPTLRLKGTISSTPLDLSVAIANIAAGAAAAFTSSQARSNILNSGLSQGVGILGSALQGKAGSLSADAFSGAVDAVSRTILLSAFQNKTPFSVLTKRQRYDDMVIQRLSFPRNEETGYALEFEMDLRQLRIVTPQTTLMSQVSENTISGAASITNLGSQATQSVSSQVTSSVAGSPLGQAPGIGEKFPGSFA